MVSKVNYRPQFLVSNDGSITIQYLSSGLTNIQTAGGGGVPASPTTSVQFNNAGAFGGSANFTYTSGTNTVSFGTIAGNIKTAAVTSGNSVGLNLTTGTASLTYDNGVSGDISIVTGNTGDTINDWNGTTGNVTISTGSDAGSGGSAGNVSITAGSAVGGNGEVSIGTASGTTIQLTDNGTRRLGFFGATPVAKPAPTASGTGNVLSSVVTALNSLGLVDSAALTNAAANFTSAAQGLVPASGGGTINFLRADGNFAAPPGGGSSTPVTLPYAATLASTSGSKVTYRVSVTGPMTISAPSGAADGDQVEFWLTASGGARTVTFAFADIPTSSTLTSPVTIASGTQGELMFRYDSVLGAWKAARFVNGYS